MSRISQRESSKLNFYFRGALNDEQRREIENEWMNESAEWMDGWNREVNNKNCPMAVLRAQVLFFAIEEKLAQKSTKFRNFASVLFSETLS